MTAIEVYVCHAYEGDIAQCKNGHDLYRLNSSLMPQTTISSGMFEPIGDAAKPHRGEQIRPCHICGAEWLVAGLAGYRMARVKRKERT